MLDHNHGRNYILNRFGSFFFVVVVGGSVGECYMYGSLQFALKYFFFLFFLMLWVKKRNILVPFFKKKLTKFQTLFGFHQLSHYCPFSIPGLISRISFCKLFIPPSLPWSVSLYPSFLVFHNFDSLEEYWSGTVYHVPQLFFSQLDWDDGFWRGNYGGWVSSSHHIKGTCSQHDHCWCQPWLFG